MANSTSIEWTRGSDGTPGATWNPTTGCTKIAAGCAKCYIERTPAFRIAGRKFVNGRTDIRLHHDRLDTPLRWRKPRKVFVNSLSDLFHEEIPDDFIAAVFNTMALAQRHTFQVLTKRPERAAALIPQFAVAHTARDGSGWPLPNVWIGTSIANQADADRNIPNLLQIPAAVRFVSAEPLIGPVDLHLRGLREALTERHEIVPPPIGFEGVPFVGNRCKNCGFMPGACDIAEFAGSRCLRCDVLLSRCLIDWVITGGESGPGARPCNVEWIRSIVAQCKAADVPVFVKQLGAKPILPMDGESWFDGRNFHDGAVMLRPRDKKGGDMAEWPTDLRIREYPAGGSR
jgi:protein gp37